MVRHSYSCFILDSDDVYSCLFFVRLMVHLQLMVQERQVPWMVMATKPHIFHLDILPDKPHPRAHQRGKKRYHGQKTQCVLSLALIVLFMFSQGGMAEHTTDGMDLVPQPWVSHLLPFVKDNLTRLAME